MKPLIFVLILLFTAGIADSRSFADAPALDADILAQRLYAKTGDEKAYCRYIIEQRNNGTLPENIFYGVYRRAAEKEKARRFVYFKTGLEILCKREGIVLPEMQTPQPEKKSFFSFFYSVFKR
jgi:hypothetical protein